MIQRKQSLYLTLFLLIILFNFFFYDKLQIHTYVIFEVLMNYLPIVFAILTVISIFMFSNRKVQYRINIILLVLSIIFEIFVITDFFKSINILNSMWLLRFISVLVSWCSLLLANKYIRKDEVLVRSIDRLR